MKYLQLFKILFLLWFQPTFYSKQFKDISLQKSQLFILCITSILLSSCLILGGDLFLALFSEQYALEQELYLFSVYELTLLRIIMFLGSMITLFLLLMYSIFSTHLIVSYLHNIQELRRITQIFILLSVSSLYLTFFFKLFEISIYFTIFYDWYWYILISLNLITFFWSFYILIIFFKETLNLSFKKSLITQCIAGIPIFLFMILLGCIMLLINVVDSELNSFDDEIEILENNTELEEIEILNYSVSNLTETWKIQLNVEIYNSSTLIDELYLNLFTMDLDSDFDEYYYSNKLIPYFGTNKQYFNYSISNSSNSNYNITFNVSKIQIDSHPNFIEEDLVLVVLSLANYKVKDEIGIDIH